MRKFVTLAVVVALALAFATSFSSTQAQSKLTGKLEIYSWWAGDEAPALDALVALYKKENPGVELINATVAGGAGVNAKAVLATRMQGGDVPDSFQVHAGQELIGTYVVADKMEALTSYFKDWGWMDKFPKDLIDLLSYKGDIWSVPVNIHRANVLWYVPAKLKEWGVEVPKTWDEFFKTAEVLKGKGVTALALGPTWTAQHLFETVLIAQLGADGWRDLWSGKLKWTDDKVKAAVDVYGKVLSYTNSDAASLGDWVPASQMLLDGKAAFQVMGDWAAGWFTAKKNLKPGVDFGWAASPGTAGIYDLLSDSFGLPKGVKDKENTLAWLKLLGSVEGQDAFNPLKGSIPARVDADVKNTKLYNEYLQSAAADWGNKDTKLVGSLTHGAVAPESFSGKFPALLEDFIKTKDTATLTAAAQELADAAGIGK